MYTYQITTSSTQAHSLSASGVEWMNSVDIYIYIVNTVAPNIHMHQNFSG